MKENSFVNGNEFKQSQFNEKISYIKCIYDIKDYNET